MQTAPSPSAGSWDYSHTAGCSDHGRWLWYPPEKNQTDTWKDRLMSIPNHIIAKLMWNTLVQKRNTSLEELHPIWVQGDSLEYPTNLVLLQNELQSPKKIYQACLSAFLLLQAKVDGPSYHGVLLLGNNQYFPRNLNNVETTKPVQTLKSPPPLREGPKYLSHF